MRHKKGFNHLSRTHTHRQAMLANMASSLILHKRIQTTTAKAKALRTYVEPLITKSKEDSTHSRRTVFSYLKSKEAVSELFREVAGKVADRPGGYTRILKLGNRQGDNADLCIIELVDYNENLLKTAQESQAKTGRKRRGSKKKADAAESPVAAAPEEETGTILDETVAEDAMKAGEEPTPADPAEETVAEKPVDQAPTETTSEEDTDTEDSGDRDESK